MQNEIVGYYQANHKKSEYCVTEDNALIVCGEFTTFPPKDDMHFYSLDFGTIMRYLLYDKKPFVFDRQAFANFQKLFYQFCVQAIAANAEAHLEMQPDEFISLKFDFMKLFDHVKKN